jgi:hypothetical protein
MRNYDQSLKRFFSMILIVPFILLGTIQFLGGYSHPFFFSSHALELFRMLAWLVIILTFGYVAYVNHQPNKIEMFRGGYVGKDNILIYIMVGVGTVSLIAFVVADVSKYIEKML